MKILARESRTAVFVCSGIVLAYGVLGLVLLVPDAVYSGDIGVKFVQARALAANRFASLDMPYPGQFLDPSRQFFPMRPPFVMSLGWTAQAIFSPAAAVLQSLLVAAGGLRGLIVGSVLSGAIVLLAAVRMAEPAHRITVAVALGVGSPLWFYAISGWEHAPAVALAMAGFAVAMVSSRPGAYALAGLLMGSGAVLRDEVILLVPGLLLVIGLRTRSVRPVVVGCVAAAIPLAAAVVLDVAWFGRPAAAHMRHAVHILDNSADPRGMMDGRIPSLEPFTLRQRYETVVQYWLLGYGEDRWIVMFGSTLVAALLVRRWRSAWSSVPLFLWLLGVMALALADARELITAPKWLAGLHRVSPYLVFAVLPAPRGERSSSFHRAVMFTTATFLVAAFVGVGTTGGKSLGPRLLLPLLALLAVTAVARIHAYTAAAGRVDRWIGITGGALVAVAIVLHVCGTVPAYYERNRIDGAAILAAGAASANVIVADDPFTAQLLFPLYYRKIILLADTPDLGRRLGAQLAKEKISDALIVSRDPQPGTRLPPLRLMRVMRVGRMVIQQWGQPSRRTDE